MTIQELKIMIREGEGHAIEFKQSIPSKITELAEELCAFANAAGGIVLVGITDKGQITGIEMDNVRRSRLQNALNAIEPSLPVKSSEIKVENDKVVLCLECESGGLKPYMVSGNIMVRNGPNSEKITSQEKMMDFFIRSDRIFFDKKTCSTFRFPDDLDEDRFRLFLTKAGISKTILIENVLCNLGLMEGQHSIKNAGVLLFAKDVQHFYQQAITRCILFKGTDKYKILDDKTYTGNLVQQYEQAYTYILSKLNLSYIIEGGGPRKEVLEIPETVFKEALINALCHRDYYEEGAVTHIEIFDDRVEISNPGGLVNSIPKKDFGTKSFSRNPLIFAMFQRMNLVEKVGSGITRMRDEMLAADLPEPDYSLEGIFTVKLYRPVDFGTWLNRWKSKLSVKQIQILQEIHANGNIIKSQLAILIGLSPSGIDLNIDKLKFLGILEREGSRKTGTWKIIQKKYNG